MGMVRAHFRPEFLNRVDEVIVFHDLSNEEIEQIVDLMVDRLRDQLLLQGFGITLDMEARSFLAKQGFDSTLGARPLRRAIQRNLEDPLSEQILGGNWTPGDVIEVFVEDGHTAFRKGEGSVVVPTHRMPKTVDSSMKTLVERGAPKRGGSAAGGAAGE